MIKDFAFFSIKKLFYKENKTFLQVLSIALLIALQTFSYGIVTNLKEYFQQSTPIQDSNIVYVVSEESTTLSEPSLFYSTIGLNANSIKAAIPFLVLDAEMEGNRLVVKASNDELFNMPGLWLNGERTIKEDRAIAGKILANLFNLTIGEKITLKIENKSLNLKISGILTSGTSLDYNLILDLNYIWNSFVELKNKISYLMIYAEKDLDKIQLEAQLEESLGQKIKIIKNERKEGIKNIFSSPLAILENWSLLISSAAFLLALLLALNNGRKFERYAGIFLALGMSRNKLRALLLIENSLILALGLLLGFSISVVSASTITKTVASLTGLSLSFNPDYALMGSRAAMTALVMTFGYIISSFILNRSIKSMML